MNPPGTPIRHPHRPPGLLALSGFFLFGTIVSGLTALALLTPGGPLDPMWRINPRAQVAFHSMGGWAVMLMAAVCTACGLCAYGLWARRRWGHRLAVAVLAVNLVGDALNALLLHDPRTLIGLPIGGLLIAYLLSPRLKRQFDPSSGAVRDPSFGQGGDQGIL
jgi:hypothetical protein